MTRWHDCLELEEAVSFFHAFDPRKFAKMFEPENLPPDWPHDLNAIEVQGSEWPLFQERVAIPYIRSFPDSGVLEELSLYVGYSFPSLRLTLRRFLGRDRQSSSGSPLVSPLWLKFTCVDSTPIIRNVDTVSETDSLDTVRPEEEAPTREERD